MNFFFKIYTSDSKNLDFPGTKFNPQPSGISTKTVGSFSAPTSQGGRDIRGPVPKFTTKIHLKSTPLFSVEIAHCCVICGGKDKDGKIDKEASNLSLSDPKRLKEHYCRHFYTEGKLFDLLPLEEGNKKEDGSILDEFGKPAK